MTNKVVVFFMLIFTCSASNALTISDVVIDKNNFSPSLNEKIIFNFHLDEKSNISIYILNAQDYIVQEISLENVAAGKHEALWDGKDKYGVIVPPEAYRYIIKASVGKKSIVYDLSNDNDSVINIRNIKWNKNSHSIHYSLPQSARVAIRVGLSNSGPLMNTVVDWAPRMASEQIESWDGWDVSREINLTEHPELEIAIDYVPLPRNTIFIQPKNKKKHITLDPTKYSSYDRVTTSSNKKYVNIPIEARGDFPAQLKLGKEYSKNKEGIPVVNGIVPIRLNIDSSFLANLASQRYEPVFFVDGKYIFEQEIGFFPMTFKWDSAAFNEGVHFITVNVRGYSDNFGIATMKLIVDRPN